MKFVEEDVRKFSIIKVDNEEPCRVCKEDTQYIEFCYEARICSTECLETTNTEIMGEVHRLENLEEQL